MRDILPQRKVEELLDCAILLENNFNIEFKNLGDRNYIAPKVLNSFLKLLKERDSDIIERFPRSYKGKNQFLYLTTRLKHKSIVKARSFLYSKYPKISLTFYKTN